MMVVCVFVITLYLPKQPRFRYEFEKGKTWMNKDLISPFSFAILKTSPQVVTDKKEALNNVLPIYKYDEDVFKGQSDAFLNEFDVKWKSNAFAENEKEGAKQTAYKMLEFVYKKGIIGLTAKHQKDGKHYDFSLLTNNVAVKSNSQDVFTTESALDFFKNNYKSINSRVKDAVIDLVESHLKPNIIFDEELTLTVQNSTINSLSTTKGMVQKEN